MIPSISRAASKSKECLLSAFFLRSSLFRNLIFQWAHRPSLIFPLCFHDPSFFDSCLSTSLHQPTWHYVLSAIVLLIIDLSMISTVCWINTCINFSCWSMDHGIISIFSLIPVSSCWRCSLPWHFFLLILSFAWCCNPYISRPILSQPCFYHTVCLMSWCWHW
jgi:hypothetical protein